MVQFGKTIYCGGKQSRRTMGNSIPGLILVHILEPEIGTQVNDYAEVQDRGVDTLGGNAGGKCQEQHVARLSGGKQVIFLEHQITLSTEGWIDSGKRDTRMGMGTKVGDCHPLMAQQQPHQCASRIARSTQYASLYHQGFLLSDFFGLAY